MPFVSQASLDARHSALVGLQARLDEQRDRAERRIAELTETIVSLKRQGFHPPEPTVSPLVPTPGLPLGVVMAIRDHMDPRGPSGRSTAEWARVALAAGTTEALVVRQIHAGSDGEDDGA